MKNLFAKLFLLILVSAVLFTGCKEETDSINEAQLLTDHLVASNMDISAITSGFVMGAPADGNVGSKWVMDLRSASDFAAAHIANAHNVVFTDILNAAKNADKPILVVCYTGQTACYATALLRMYGYSDAQALKWGMSGWNASFDKWTANCKDLTNANNWTTAATEASLYELPEISTGMLIGSEILKKQVEKVVAAGFKTVSGADVLAKPENYYINNYFSAEHYAGFGHVKGAVRINPLLVGDGSIKKLDPSKEIVTYCYTGQTSGVITAYLNVLGYNAKSLLFGINGMSTSNSFWTSGNVTNHWGFDSKPKSLPTTTN